MVRTQGSQSLALDLILIAAPQLGEWLNAQAQIENSGGQLVEIRAER